MRARTSGHAILIGDEEKTDPSPDGESLVKPSYKNQRRFKGEFITITPPLVHLRSEVAATFAQPIDSRDTKLATPQTVVSANSGRWGRLRFAEVLTTLSTE